MNDPVAAYFDKLPQIHKRQFVQGASGASFYFQTRLKLACELAGASAGRLLDCAAGTGEITCALLKSGSFSHATIVDISPAMLRSAKELLRSQITNLELELICSDAFNFKPSDSRFDLILCLGLIAHVGRLDVLLPHLKSMLTPERAHHFADNTYRSRWRKDCARAYRTPRAGAARIPHFLVFPARHKPRVPSRRAANPGRTKAQPGHSVW